MGLADGREVEQWVMRAPEAGFPATRDDVLAALEHAGAPAEVVAAVRAIPPDMYSRPDQVAAAADAVPDVTSEPTTGSAGRQVPGGAGERHEDVDRPRSDEP